MIKVLFFSYLRDKIGLPSVDIEKDKATIKEIKDYIKNNYNIESFEDIMTAVNKHYVSDEKLVVSGDTVAFITPVAGG